MIDPSSVLSLRPDVRFRVVGGEAVVLQQESAEVMIINEVGARILELLDGSRPLSEIGAVLEGEFEVERGRLDSDLASFAQELLDAGLARIAEAPAG